MGDLWPWLAIAGAGALHGLSPANGWLLAAACGVRARAAAQPLDALRLVACGQLASIGVLAAALALDVVLDRALMRDVAGALLVAAGALQGLARGDARQRWHRHAARGGIVVCSFAMASAQGAGTILVPSLVPWCSAAAPAGATAFSLFVAIGVHVAAMLLATRLVALAACRAVASCGLLRSDAAWRRSSAAALAIFGAVLLAAR